MNYGFRLLTNYDKENTMEKTLFLDTFEIILYCLVVRVSNSSVAILAILWQYIAISMVRMP
jgi:hypothetical protein